jgi:signal transduction histidine kinase
MSATTLGDVANAGTHHRRLIAIVWISAMQTTPIDRNTRARQLARDAPSESWASSLPWVVCAVVIAMLAPIAILGILNRNAEDVWRIAEPYQVVAAVAYSVVGALVTTRCQGNRLGWLFLAMGFLAQAGSLCAAWAVYSLVTRPELPGGGLALWTNVWIGVIALFPMFPLLLFPSGHIADWRTGVVAALTILATAGLVSALMSGQVVPPGFPQLYEQTPIPFKLSPAFVDPGLCVMMLGVCGILSVALLIGRFRAAQGEVRKQYTWVVAAMVLLVAAFVADFLARAFGTHAYVVTGPLLSLSFVLIPIMMGIAILRYRLWDIDIFINRALVYLALTACVVVIYIFIVGWLSSVFRSDGNLLFSLVATGVVAVLFHPLRVYIQRLVSRMLFGERDEPYAVIARLGQRLESTLAPDAVLPAIVGTVREALKLPYAAIAVTGGAGPVYAVASGEPVRDPLTLPLVYQHVPVGEFVLGPRSPGESFGMADLRLLDDLARQAGIAVHAVQLTHELQQARERLVETREEERRRLRRDLHDGLGSQLAALNLQWGALPTLIDSDPASAKAEVAELRTQLRKAIASIRTLVHGLRPPAIDELGLLVALQERLRQYNTGDLVVESGLPEHLPELPAAVEVAVYRIVEEALANVSNHARAHWCAVQLVIGNELLLEINDDGVGIGSDYEAGVGLQSMRERTAELGGSLAISPRPPGGTTLSVRLPLPGGAASDE